MGKTAASISGLDRAYIRGACPQSAPPVTVAAHPHGMAAGGAPMRDPIMPRLTRCLAQACSGVRTITQRLVWLEIDRLNREPTDEGRSLDDVLA